MESPPLRALGPVEKQVDKQPPHLGKTQDPPSSHLLKKSLPSDFARHPEKRDRGVPTPGRARGFAAARARPSQASCSRLRRSARPGRGPIEVGASGSTPPPNHPSKGSTHPRWGSTPPIEGLDPTHRRAQPPPIEGLNPPSLGFNPTPPWGQPHPSLGSTPPALTGVQPHPSPGSTPPSLGVNPTSAWGRPHPRWGSTPPLHGVDPTLAEVQPHLCMGSTPPSLRSNPTSAWGRPHPR